MVHSYNQVTLNSVLTLADMWRELRNILSDSTYGEFNVRPNLSEAFGVKIVATLGIGSDCGGLWEFWGTGNLYTLIWVISMMVDGYGRTGVYIRKNPWGSLYCL